MKNYKIVKFLPCDDCAEAFEFMITTFDDGCNWCEMNLLDSYCGERETKLKYRIKRAWRAFKGTPLYYTGVCVEDLDKVKKFFMECVDAINGVEKK